MTHKACTPLHQVKVGSLVTPRFFISDQTIKHWTHAKECSSIGGGLVAGTARLEVAEISPMTMNASRWIRLGILGTDPQKTLKLTAEEYMSKFSAA